MIQNHKNNVSNDTCDDINNNKSQEFGSLYYLYKTNNNLFPISFSIPKSKIVDKIHNKTKMVSDLYPGNRDTYIYYTEEDYYNEYRKSIFAYTFRKGGWDCMRHYEILACGCIPHFVDFEKCPNNILLFLPKDLIKIGNKLFEIYKDKRIEDLTEKDKEILCEHINKLLKHTRAYLTTEKLASYLLKTLSDRVYVKDVKKILVLSADSWSEYLRCTILHGLKNIFGKNCHDYPKVRHLYKNEELDYYSYCYGKGYSYSNLLEQECRDNELDNTIEEDIKNKKYDIIIWADFYRWFLNCAKFPDVFSFYDLAQKYYEPNRLIFLNGWDSQYDIYNFYMEYVEKGHIVFVREFLDSNS